MNQWLNPLKCGTSSNLVDMGWAAVRVNPSNEEDNSDVGYPCRLSPATLNDDEGVTLRDHEFVNVLSPWSSFGGTTMVKLLARVELLRRHLGDSSSGRGLVDNRL